MVPTEFLQAAGFDASAIAENRAGRLTARQGEIARTQHGRKSFNEIAMGILMLLVVSVIGIVQWHRGHGLAGRNDIDIAVITILFVAPLAILVRVRWKRSRVEKDIAAGRVDVIEGPGRPYWFRTRRNTYHYLVVNDVRFEVDRKAFELIDPNATPTYRAYYLPKTQTLVNVEILP